MDAQNIEDIMMLIGAGEYERTKSNKMGRELLKDMLIDMSEDLHTSGAIEGRRYTARTLLIKPGEPLPQPHTTLVLKTALSDKSVEVRVMEITGLFWGAEGVEINILGTFKMVDDSD